MLLGEHPWTRGRSIEGRLTTYSSIAYLFIASNRTIPEIHGIPLGLMGGFVWWGKVIAPLAGVLAWGEESCVARTSLSFFRELTVARLDFEDFWESGEEGCDDLGIEMAARILLDSIEDVCLGPGGFVDPLTR
jgi:hypothetical protein